MSFLRDYNENDFLNSWKEDVKVTLDTILQSLGTCKRYTINSDVSNYLRYIDDEVFYVAPSFEQVKTNNKISTLNPHFILFSAPGATGKSCLAKHIAYTHNAIYWDTSKLKLGENTFDGSILKMVGAADYSRFTTDLKNGNTALVIDAFDEAEAISGRTAVQQFIEDLERCVNGATVPCVFMFSRTETAQFIASLCVENDIALQHYEIGFFEETQAVNFMEGQIENLKKGEVEKRGHGESSVTNAEKDCIKKYYNAIQNSISANEKASFLGYAPVLQAIASEIKGTSNTAILISKLTGKENCTDIIIQIMNALLKREQDKVTDAFANKCKSEHPEFTEWKTVYSPEEQLSRIVFYILFGDTPYNAYEKMNLPSQLIDEYQTLLKSFLPQHPFIQNYVKGSALQTEGIHFTGPAFRDYTLAKLILSSDGAPLAQMYLDESTGDNFSPSPIFADCYLNLCNNTIHSSHISYIYESYRSKAHALEKSYLQYTEPLDEDEKKSAENVIRGNVMLGMVASRRESQPKQLEFGMIIDFPKDPELCFDRMYNVSIDAPNFTVCVGRSKADTSIHNSEIICKRIKWKTEHLLIEAKNPNGCLICTSEPSVGNPQRIEIVCDENLKVSMPDIAPYYKLLRYKYDFDDSSDIDIVKFTHALRCILVEFRSHSKDTLAKHIERIDNVVVGNNPIKQRVLAFMKDMGIVYEETHLYKIDTSKMQECKISFNGLLSMNFDQLEEGYRKFKSWDANMH